MGPSYSKNELSKIKATEEPSYTVDGNVNWSSHCGMHREVPQKN